MIVCANPLVSVGISGQVRHFEVVFRRGSNPSVQGKDGISDWAAERDGRVCQRPS